MKNQIIKIIAFVLATGYFSTVLAVNSYRLNNGEDQLISEHEICKDISNASGRDLFIPTRTLLEWTRFWNNPPTGVTAGSCSVSNPDAITDLAYAGRSSSSISLSWSAPADNGTPISDYLIEYKVSADSNWIIYVDGVGTSTSTTIAGLAPSTSYDFRVAALNGGQGAYSNTLTQETAPNDPFFNPLIFSAMNCGGATRSQVVALLDNTDIALNGSLVSGSPIDSGDTLEFNTALGGILTSSKPFFIAGRLSRSGGDANSGNIVWNVPDWAGKNFITVGSRSSEHVVTIFAFEDANITITRGGVTEVNNDSVAAGSFRTYRMNNNAGYKITSTGTITAYQYSEGGGNDQVVDNLPIIPPATDIIGIPSTAGQYTTIASSTTAAWYESNDTSTTGITLTQGAFNSYGGNGNQYNAPSARMIANDPVIGRSNADSDGSDSSPFVPKSFQKRMFAINHLAEWVAFVSTEPATIREFLPSGAVSTFTLSRTGSGTLTPYFGRRTNVTAGAIYESDQPFHAYYETDEPSETSNEREDETILFGWYGYPELPVSFKLKLWLDASDINTLYQNDNCTGVVSTNGENIGCWRDKTLHGHNVTQAGINKPTYVVNSFGRKPGIDFNGGANFLNFDESLIEGKQYTIFAIIHRDNPSTNSYFLGTQSAAANQGLHLGFNSNTSARFGQFSNDLSATVTGQTENSVGLFYARLNSSGKKIYFNNVTSTDSTNTQLNSAGQGVIGRGFDSNGFDGQIAEILIYDRALDDTEVNLVVDYLNEKWFNPDIDTRLRFWVDASDPSQMFTNTSCTTPVTSAGDNVLCWRDKSGFGYSAIQSSGTPQWQNDSGYNIVNFTNDSLFVEGSPGGAIFTNGTSLSSVDIFALMKSSSSAENGYLFTHASGADLSAQVPDNSSFVVFNHDTGTSGTLSSAWGGNTTNYFLWNFAADQGSNTQIVYRDTNLVASDTTASILSISTDDFFLGSQTGSSNFQNFRLGSFLIYNQKLSDRERHLVRAYFKIKWAL